MEFKIETIPNYRIAYVRQVGPYGVGNSQAMERLKKWAEKNHLLTDSSIILGISQDNPETTLPENCRYDACIVLPSDYQLDDSMGEGIVCGGSYAVCKVRHTAEDIQDAWTNIFSYIQKAGYDIESKPIFERYTGNMIFNDYCEICVPIKSI